MKKLWILILAGGLFSCQGTAGTDIDLIDNSNTEKETTDETTQEDDPIVPAFNFERSTIRLLPFHVRMQKLANVVGVTTDDPMFSELKNNRYSLGDHNYGSNIGPDLNWNASKMALWVRSIQPLCNSEAMAVRYPSLPDDVDGLWAAAHLRPISEEERSDLTTIDVTNLDAAGQYQAYCVAVLSSAEFVAQ